MMTSDYNKKIHSISYNILNLPREVRFNDGHIIRYTYDASGTKLKAEYLLSDVRLMDWDDAAVIAGDDAAAPASLQTGGTGLPMVGLGGDAGLMPPGSEVMVEPVTLMTVEYSGGHVYRNGRLERVDNPYGYWADSTFHYHITDHQGNIRAVIAGDSAQEEVNNYYPYGGLMGAADTGVQPHKYGAKELDRENSLDLYDSHARWYDPLLARTTTQDPLAEKYRHLSPYLWCADNPIRNIDEGGDSIAVLYYHGLIGHLALLIQDENKKWSYFSMNGTKIFGGSSGMSYGKSGGKPYNDLGIMKFNSPTEFLNSQYNREGSYDETQDNTVNNYGYEDAYVIPTTRVQDASIERVFRTEARKSYNLFWHQCAHVVQNALNAGGLKTTLKQYNVTNFEMEMETIPFMPSSTFEAIRQKNKQGKLIKRKWKK